MEEIRPKEEEITLTSEDDTILDDVWDRIAREDAEREDGGDLPPLEDDTES